MFVKSAHKTEKRSKSQDRFLNKCYKKHKLSRDLDDAGAMLVAIYFYGFWVVGLIYLLYGILGRTGSPIDFLKRISF
jgi:hypothetical protein